MKSRCYRNVFATVNAICLTVIKILILIIISNTELISTRRYTRVAIIERSRGPRKRFYFFGNLTLRYIIINYFQSNRQPLNTPRGGGRCYDKMLIKLQRLKWLCSAA